MATKERTPLVIRRFTMDYLVLLFNTTGKLPLDPNEKPGTEKPDPGVVVALEGGKDGKIATSTWQASAALSSDFRARMLKEIAVLVPSNGGDQKGQIVLVPRLVSEPIKLQDGQWQVNFVGDLQVFSPQFPIGETVSFNKRIFLHAIDSPIATDMASPLARSIYQVRSAGLEIYDIRDLESQTPQP